jgi:uncharacterized protein (TIGR03083 family)
VTTPPYAELTAAIRREGEAILAAGRQGLDVAVPTCADWTMTDLLTHLARVYRRATTIVEQRATTEVPFPPVEDVADPLAHLGEALDDLVAALAAAQPDSPVWNWSGRDETAAFWARRMAHESAVHRFDAQRAHDVAQPVDAELAYDGLDELFDVIVPRVVARDSVVLPAGTFAFASTDEGSRCIRTGADGLERLDVLKDADVTVHGTTSALLLAAYNRVPWASLEVSGNADLLAQWSAALHF